MWPNPKAIGTALRDVERQLGAIDILVNNAGIGGEPTIEETSEHEFDRMFAVHVKGTFFATQAVVPSMKQRRFGKIINISSTWGMVGHHYASALLRCQGGDTRALPRRGQKSWRRGISP